MELETSTDATLFDSVPSAPKPLAKKAKTLHELSTSDDPKPIPNSTALTSREGRAKSPKGTASTYKPSRSSHLARIPLELLAEILSFVPSPRDVLAVARCDKYLCATLVRRSSDFIWRQARRNFRAGRIPDPTPNWTESAYAAWLFDPAPCHVCKKTAKAFTSCYAMRIRLCASNDCHRAFGRTLMQAPPTVAGDAVSGWLPSVEAGAVLCVVKSSTTASTTIYYPDMDKWYRKEELEPALAAYQEAQNSSAESDAVLTQFLVAHEAETRRNVTMMEHAVVLQKWKRAFEALARRIRQLNDVTAHQIAAKEGWSWDDLKVARTFEMYLRAHNNSLEQISMSDFQFIRDRVEPEIINIVERRRRREEENTYRQNRARVALHYQRMKSAGMHEPMPSLTEFHRLPVVKALESAAPEAEDVSEQLKSTQFLKEMLDKDLDKWREKAKARLAAVLGYSGWKSASVNKLHPVERLTARFVCKLCKKVAKKYEEYGSLDYAGVCAHKCTHLNKKQRAKFVWKAEQFEPDEKAIKVISQVLQLTHTDPEDPHALAVMAGYGERIQCESCDAAIVMDFNRLCMHSRRHDDMKVKLILQDEANAILKHPIETGLHAKLMEQSYHAKKARSLKEYGCRHCTQRKNVVAEVNATAPSNGAAPNADAAAPEPKPSATPHGRLWDFNGLRSHAKSKHGIETLGDEDFYHLAPKPESSS